MIINRIIINPLFWYWSYLRQSEFIGTEFRPVLSELWTEWWTYRMIRRSSWLTISAHGPQQHITIVTSLNSPQGASNLCVKPNVRLVAPIGYFQSDKHWQRIGFSNFTSTPAVIDNYTQNRTIYKWSKNNFFLYFVHWPVLNCSIS